jgi:hypothetical protein
VGSPDLFDRGSVERSREVDTSDLGGKKRAKLPN